MKNCLVSEKVRYEKVKSLAPTLHFPKFPFPSLSVCFPSPSLPYISHIFSFYFPTFPVPFVVPYFCPFLSIFLFLSLSSPFPPDLPFPYLPIFYFSPSLPFPFPTFTLPYLSPSLYPSRPLLLGL